MSFYGDFTIEEAGDIGKEFKVICHNASSYDGKLTNGKEYLIRIETRILPMSPICSFISDNGKRSECHLTRFSKIPENRYKNYTDAELKTALNQLESLIATRAGMGDEICEANKLAYTELKEMIKLRNL